MRKLPHKPVLFFDFDNTLTQGDVLDDLIERYSPNEFWRDWENAWAKGDLPARDCLRLQVENMRVPRARLLEDVARVRIDPSFAEIVDWARRHQVEVQIVSDSFLPLIRHILHANGIAGIPVLANRLEFANRSCPICEGRLRAGPLRKPSLEQRCQQHDREQYPPAGPAGAVK